MDTFENESINIYESIYESIDDILNKTFPDSTYKEDTSSADKGSNNSVTKYVVTSNDTTSTKNIVVRQSMKSLLPEDIPEYLIHNFIGEENNDTKKRKRIDGDIDFDYIRRYIEDLIITNSDTYSFIDKDYSNWKNASDDGISPKLFFYGFLIVTIFSALSLTILNPSIDQNIHHTIILGILMGFVGTLALFSRNFFMLMEVLDPIKFSNIIFEVEPTLSNTTL